jgi:hypothetical protein
VYIAPLSYCSRGLANSEYNADLPRVQANARLNSDPVPNLDRGKPNEWMVVSEKIHDHIKPSRQSHPALHGTGFLLFRNSFPSIGHLRSGATGSEGSVTTPLSSASVTYGSM